MCSRGGRTAARPSPSNTAARSIWISSSSPASRHCWIVWAPCTPTDFAPAADFARATALSMPSVTNWTVESGRGQPSGTLWVTTNAGISHGCRPPQPSARSKVRRPVSMAPTSAVKALRWSALGGETLNVMPELPLAVGTSTSPEKYQSKTSATPSFASATYPSRDIDISATTLLVTWCSFSRRAGVVLSSETQQGRLNHRSPRRRSTASAPRRRSWAQFARRRAC